MLRTAALSALVVSLMSGSATVPTDAATRSGCPPAVVSVGDFAQYEGSVQGPRAFTFTVEVAAQAGCTATGSVQVVTGDGTATAPLDYQPTATTVAWNGDTSPRTVVVPVVTDETGEPDETFTVQLTAPVGVAIGDGQASGTIVDDDDPPVWSSVDGGKICWRYDDTCRVGVRLGEQARAPITVRFRTHRLGDGIPGYEPVRDGLVTIARGAHSGEAVIRLRPGQHPPLERFVVEIFDPSAGTVARATAEVVIRSGR